MGNPVESARTIAVDDIKRIKDLFEYGAMAHARRAIIAWRETGDGEELEGLLKLTGPVVEALADLHTDDEHGLLREDLVAAAHEGIIDAANSLEISNFMYASWLIGYIDRAMLAAIPSMLPGFSQDLGEEIITDQTGARRPASRMLAAVVCGWNARFQDWKADRMTVAAIRPDGSLVSIDAPSQHDLAVSADTPEDALQRKEHRQALEAAMPGIMEQLTQREIQVLQSRMAGFKLREVAQELRISMARADQLEKSASRKIRTALRRGSLTGGACPV